ncbi:glucose transporter [Oenococcus sp. UCMA 16435]|nr:glucose transporter [Oenococcus sp. UCMA 16435]MDI4584474.1 glucose transporter [Oenococcus sp. UCMA 14587]
MAILMALIPPLTWGSVGLICTKMGGSAGQQVLGESLGALILGTFIYLTFVIPRGVIITDRIWIVGILSGLFWAVGTSEQFIAFKKMGVSSALPISTAGQIISNALMAAAVLGEWITVKMWLFGSISIALITIGAILTAARSTLDKHQATKRPATYNQGMIVLIISTVGFMLYFVFPNLLVKVGYISNHIHNANNGINYMTAIVTPQAVGQVIGSILIIIFLFHERTIMFQKYTWKNLTTGIDWGIGNLFMFISAANPLIGQAMATTLSQTGVIIGTFGGIYLLHEYKTKDQMVRIVIGSGLVILGSVLISNLKALG